MAKIRREDTVLVIKGKERGKTGVVRQVIPRHRRVIVTGVNIVKRHMRPRADRPGGIIEREAPIHVSNVMIICKSCSKPTRVGFRFREGGGKARFCSHCGQPLD
ncbi:MAG: 50S ribosomal protein L24 [Dehalococcoidia bacterium SM23_28_1]|nr:MAG: 50S ribosomal protein L24 [Dehalococcoidia bacterium SM23_28_1]